MLLFIILLFFPFFKQQKMQRIILYTLYCHTASLSAQRTGVDPETLGIFSNQESIWNHFHDPKNQNPNPIVRSKIQPLLRLRLCSIGTSTCLQATCLTRCHVCLEHLSIFFGYIRKSGNWFEMCLGMPWSLAMTNWSNRQGLPLILSIGVKRCD